MLKIFEPYLKKDENIEYFRYYIGDFSSNYKKLPEKLFNVEQFFDFNISTFSSWLMSLKVIGVYNYNKKKIRFYCSSEGYDILNLISVDNLEYVGYSETCEYYVFECSSYSLFYQFVLKRFPKLF